MRSSAGRRVGWFQSGIMVALIVALGSAGPVRSVQAQEPTYEQLRKMYDDALKELKASQERKNQLSEENDRLKANLEDFRKQLAAANTRVAELQRDQQEEADKTFFLRSHYAAWEAFIRQYPELRGRWKVYIESDYVDPQHELPAILNGCNPTTAES